MLLNWFEAKSQLSSGTVEGFNNKVKLTMRKAYGFKSSNSLKISLYHALGDLPVSQTPHRLFEEEIIILFNDLVNFYGCG